MKKPCTICLKTKELDFFSKNPNGMKDGHLNQCKSCIEMRVKKWRLANPSIVKERMRTQYERHKKRVAANSIKWNKENKVRRKAIRDRWRLKSKDQITQIANNYRSRLAGAEGTFTLEEYKNKLAHFGGMCAYCKIRKATTRDHMIPVTRGGSNYLTNVVPSCLPCNSSKADLLLAEWRKTKYFNKNCVNLKEK